MLSKVLNNSNSYVLIVSNTENKIKVFFKNLEVSKQAIRVAFLS